MIRFIVLALFISSSYLTAQVRDIVRLNVDYSIRTSSDTLRNSWPTMLTVRWTGSASPDTLMVKYISSTGIASTLSFYDPMTDKVDTLMIRTAPIQSVYLWSRKNHRMYVQRKGGALKSGSSAMLVFE